MTTGTQVRPVGHSLPLVKRWATAINTCNCPDIERADTFTRWLVISRACVFSMTFTSGLIGVLLAAAVGAFTENTLFKIWLALLCVVGLVAAHATNNLVNDYTDVKRGVDTEDYPRSQYSVHPVLDGLTTPGGLLKVAGALTLLDGLIMLYLAAVTGPLVIFFAVAGLALSLGYTIFLKRYALGELTALVVWGPLVIGGTVYAISGVITTELLLLTLPYGLVVASALIGKHTDKIENDRPVGVNSVPVLLGEPNSLRLNKITCVVFYVLVIALMALPITGPWILLTFLAPVYPSHRLVYHRQGARHPISADPGLLRHVIVNLLTNAIKYSPAGSQVELRLHFTDRQAVIAVSDQGIGIPSEDLPRRQCRRPRRHRSGAGHRQRGG